MSQKKKTKRQQAKYPALDPKLNLKTRTDLIDFDYIDNLPKTVDQVDPKTGRITKVDPREYLNNFVNEHIHAEFQEKDRVHKKVKRQGEHNPTLKEIKFKVKQLIVAINTVINKSNLTPSIKNRLKKSVIRFKTDFNTVVKENLVIIEDIYKKDAYDRNNARNRCIVTRARAQGKVIGIDDLPESFAHNLDFEDAIIEKIDMERSNPVEKLGDSDEDT